MPSKMVTDRQKSANYLLALEFTQIPQILPELEALYAPALAEPDTPFPDLTSFVHALMNTLRRDIAAVVTTDVDHEAELLDDPPHRDLRDQFTDDLHGRTVTLRDLIRSAYGPTAVRDLGFSGETPRDPVVLSRLVTDVCRRLQNPASLPAPRFPGFTWDPASTVQDLEATNTKLQLQLDRLQLEAREAQVTQTAKNAALATYDATFSRVANFLSALFTLAGADDLASRIRPVPSRPGRLDPSVLNEADPITPTPPEPVTPA